MGGFRIGYPLFFDFFLSLRKMEEVKVKVACEGLTFQEDLKRSTRRRGSAGEVTRSG